MVKSVVMVLVSVIIGAIAVVGLSNLTGVSPFVSQRNDRSQPALLKSIKDISQYHAAVGNFETVVDIDDNVPGLPSAIAGRRTLFVAAGTVNAYVDLSSFADDDLKLSADGKSVTVRLPEAVLDKPNLDHDRSYVFSQDRGSSTGSPTHGDSPTGGVLQTCRDEADFCCAGIQTPGTGCREHQDHVDRDVQLSRDPSHLPLKDIPIRYASPDRDNTRCTVGVWMPSRKPLHVGPQRRWTRIAMIRVHRRVSSR